jgi:hypothetical protein
MTMRRKEFHVRNPGYNRDKETSIQDKMWSNMLVGIMSQQSVCGRQIYVQNLQIARSQRQDKEFKSARVLHRKKSLGHALVMSAVSLRRSVGKIPGQVPS